MQNPNLTNQLRAVFGDTAVDAVKELRCVKPPMGCGEKLITICGANPDPAIGPCVLEPDHDGDHVPVTQVRGTMHEDASNRRVSAAFRDDASVSEYLVVGMCQGCQDRFEQESRQREAELDRMEGADEC